MKQLAEDLTEVRPTLLISVPRIYERIYALVMQHRSQANPVQRALLDLTLAVGGRRFAARQTRRQPSLRDRMAWPLLQRLVATTVLAHFGGRLTGRRQRRRADRGTDRRGCFSRSVSTCCRATA